MRYFFLSIAAAAWIGSAQRAGAANLPGEGHLRLYHTHPRVFDLLSDLTAASGHPDAEISVICGYRAPRSDEFLRTHTYAVAKHSLHMDAEAIDVRLPGVQTANCPASNFIHVDAGRVRRW